MTDPNTNTPGNVEVLYKGEPIEEDELDRVVVEQDLNQPDMCVVVLKNSNHERSSGGQTESCSSEPSDKSITLGEPVEVKFKGTAVFKGQVVGIEPSYQPGKPSTCLVRCFNKMHLLLRGRKSETFVDKTDAQIVQKIADNNGITAEVDSNTASATRAHEYQHNETDLEFIRRIAERIGYEITMGVDEKLKFAPAKKDEESNVELQLQQSGESSGAVTRCSLRMSSSQVVNKVEVRGWDPENKEEITFAAESSNSPLGATTAVAASGEPSQNAVVYEVDHPIFNQDEAELLAKARLNELAMNYITGEVECSGNPEVKAGLVIKLVVNDRTSEDRFNGKYLAEGVSHRYARRGGYKTLVRVIRDAEGGQ